MSKVKGTALKEEHRAWLVTRWAAYGRHAEVMREFTQTFGFECPSNRARNYDLSGIRTQDEAKARGLGKWFELFQRTRTEFEASVCDIPIASAAYRIKQLDVMFEQAMEKRNFRSAAALLEQAAKETGGAFSNRRVMSGSVDVEHKVEDVPIDIKRSAVAQIVLAAVAEAMAKRPQLANPATVTIDVPAG